ncbi:hypothetical protein [Streptomyces sp. NPDC001137]|uniref:hypothetical protein n=1 Tax=Streptomyces sp. NPDC001137 TaxID=3154378 RepID=UPI0033291B49
MATDHDDERDAITAAIQRLLDGRPTRSTGALTTLQLAVEADVKRWVLTHKHVDLKDEFVRRKSEANGIPPALQHLHARAIDAEAVVHCGRTTAGFASASPSMPRSSMNSGPSWAGARQQHPVQSRTEPPHQHHLMRGNGR